MSQATPTKLDVIFSAVDSWCFREARPMESVGGTAINTVFPPPVFTLVGACRTLLGDFADVDWRDFAKNDDGLAAKWLGDSYNTGELAFNYPYLRISRNDAPERLYPVPAVLAGKDDTLLSMEFPTDLVHCDLGKVVLPALPEGIVGAKTFSETYVTQSGFNALLQGQLPSVDELVQITDLIAKETRLGIGRDQESGSVLQGHLYQTEHLRVTDTSLEIVLGLDDVAVPEKLTTKPITTLLDSSHYIRLGGEGRMAQASFVPSELSSAKADISGEQALLYLVSHADFSGLIPDGFKAVTDANQQTKWQGDIAGQTVSIVSVCADKTHRLGGWDSKHFAPKPVRNLVPAGTCYLIECSDLSALNESLHSTRLGQQTDFGFGQACLLPLIHN